MTVIRFPSIRNDDNRPAAKFRTSDEHGRDMFRFAGDYSFEGRTFSVSLWAYDIDDAERRIAAIRENFRLRGQIYCEVQ